MGVVSRIPRGRVSTYAEVARAAGNPKASRAVGKVLNSNRAAEVPCHRVVRSDALHGCFNLGVEKKIRLLEAEGVSITKGKVTDFGERFFRLM